MTSVDLFALAVLFLVLSDWLMRFAPDDSAPLDTTRQVAASLAVLVASLACTALGLVCAIAGGIAELGWALGLTITAVGLLGPWVWRSR